MSGAQEELIRRCYQLAEEARQRGDQPFGALLEKEGEVLFEARNTIATENDLTGHAELNLIRDAFRELGEEAPRDATLYSSTEPCAMCAGAIYWAGISTVVFGCSAEALGRIAGGELVVPCREVLSHGLRLVQVVGPILEQEGVRQHESFWKGLDA